MFKEMEDVFTIAEISCNHGGDFTAAVNLIRRAAESGASAVKFQAYTPKTMTINCTNRHFMIQHPEWGGQTLYELYQKARTPWDWFPALKKEAESKGLIFLCTSFDTTSVDMLEELGVCAHKIASFELIDNELFIHAAVTGKPLILSTGMATLSEIDFAVRTARAAGTTDLLLLRCVSSYPAKPQDMDLNTLMDMKKQYGCPVGVSDHTLGNEVAIASVALGGIVVEKHFINSREFKSYDNFFSTEPSEFADMVNSVKITKEAIGEVRYGPTEEEKKNRIFRRSLFVVKNVKKGDKFTRENVRSIRPSGGLAPVFLNSVDILGSKATMDIQRGTPLDWDMIDN